jgi:hypothetical protein
MTVEARCRTRRLSSETKRGTGPAGSSSSPAGTRQGKVPVVCDLRTCELRVHLPSLGQYAKSAKQRFAQPEHAHRRRPRVAA